jgi:DNA (cytosine-5)-methyltransferase 1
MRHGSLFSGIGGFDLAASWMNWDNVFNCEKDPFCRKVLRHYWPKAHGYEDICGFDATLYKGTVDIITGGFPCQPFSVAGKRKGSEDDRYIWPEALRIIKEIQPAWIVLENVTGLLNILEPGSLSKVESKAIQLFYEDKLHEKNSTILSIQRRIIGAIISEIRSAGYILPELRDGTPVILCIPACAVGAPHRRDRIWFIAYADRQGLERWPVDTHTQGKRKEKNQYSFGLPDSSIWQTGPTQPPFCSRYDGVSWQLDGISISRFRKESLKAYGNAIVPQVAFSIFETIQNGGGAE